MSSSNVYKPEILVVLSRFPFPLEKGDKLRAYYQLRELSKTFNITLVALTDRTIKESEIDEVKKYCTDIHIHHLSLLRRWINVVIGLLSSQPVQTHYFYSPSAHQNIRTLMKTKDFKHVYCQLIRVAEYVKNYHQIPKTIDFMDALSAGIQRRIDRQPFYKRWVFKMEAHRLAQYEQRIFDFFEFRTIISDQDRKLIAHPDQEKILCIPNGIDSSFFETLNRPEQFDFVFVGNMSYAPNVEAVHFIAEHVLPAISGATLLISGATPHPSIVKLTKQHPNITITGWVDDIRDAYVNGKVFLAPMMIGTGMQNKLLEAMALKTPCITTALANNAIHAKHDQEILVGNTPEEIITLAKELLADPAKREKIAHAGHTLIKSRYSWEKSTQELVKIMTDSIRHKEA